jgi:hypothetical protein
MPPRLRQWRLNFDGFPVFAVRRFSLPTRRSSRTLLHMKALTTACLLLTSILVRGEEPLHAGARLLKNGTLTVEIMDPADPHRYNSGVRYTPIAGVLRVVRDGKEFLYNPKERDALYATAGLFAEFDLRSTPPGFAEAKIGEGHLKIGVGVLKKEAESYNFWPPHPVLKLPKTEVKWRESSAEFRQECALGKSPDESSYAYDLRADLRLQDSSIVVDWSLKNTGRKPLETIHYTHNCVIFPGHNCGPGYVITLPYAPMCKGEEAKKKLWKVEGGALTFLDKISGLDIEINTPPDDASANEVTVSHEKDPRSVKFTVTLPSKWVALHCASFYVCPEQFVEIKLKPGETQKWTRTYTFDIKK